MEQWIELFAAMAGWAAVILGATTYLHSRRTETINDLRKEIAKEREDNADAHEAMRVQIADIVRTIGETYVRKSDSDRDLREIKHQIGETRKDIARMTERLDAMFQRVQWRGDD